MLAPDDREGTLALFSEGPAALEEAVAGLKDPVLDAVPSGGGWTIREIVHHIADGDDLWKIGIKMAMGAEGSEFALGWYVSMPQQDWGDRWAYHRRSIDASLSLLKASRRHIVQLLESVPESWDRAVQLHSRDGQTERVPVGFVVHMQGEHLFHHLRRIRDILTELDGR